MFTDKIREHVKSDWMSIPRDDVKTYRRRLRLRVIQTLKDLTLVTEHSSEDQLKQMFTEQTVKPLLLALTGKDPKLRTERQYKLLKMMLRVAYGGLSPQIASRYRPVIIPDLDKYIVLLEYVPNKPRIVTESVEESEEEMNERPDSVKKLRVRSTKKSIDL